MKMTGLDAYKFALARGLSGKEASYEYGIKHYTYHASLNSEILHVEAIIGSKAPSIQPTAGVGR